MNQYKQVLGLYRTLLRKGRTLHYTDKGYYFKRIRSEFDKNKHLDKKEEIEKCIEVHFFLVKLFYIQLYWMYLDKIGHYGRDRIVVGFTTTSVISTYQHYSCEFKSHLWRGVLHTTFCDKFCQLFAAGQCFSLGTPVSSTNKTNIHDIAKILLKVSLSTITLTLFGHIGTYIKIFWLFFLIEASF